MAVLILVLVAAVGVLFMARFFFAFCREDIADRRLRRTGKLRSQLEPDDPRWEIEIERPSPGVAHALPRDRRGA